MVKEYISPAEKVFAVTWQGPFQPDLHQLLGAYFDQYTQAVQTQRAARHGHGPLLIQQPGLVLQITEHIRLFPGKAYVPKCRRRASVLAGPRIDENHPNRQAELVSPPLCLRKMLSIADRSSFC